MLYEIINPITLLISLTAVAGVFMHDTRIDKALITAITEPSITSDYRSEPVKLLSIDQHVHAERASFSSAASLNSVQPATQPRNGDDKKYIAARRLMGNSNGHEYSWPSI